MSKSYKIITDQAGVIAYGETIYIKSIVCNINFI